MKYPPATFMLNQLFVTSFIQTQKIKV